jgi:8-oxo-dGTP diphosphatase
VKPVVAVGAIVWDGDRVLVVRRGTPPSEGSWTVPGGKLELGERLEAAVVREVREETGLDVTCGALAAVVERSGEGWHYVILDYHATLRGGTLRPGDDVTDARWVTLDELRAMPHTEGLLEILERQLSASPPAPPR